MYLKQSSWLERSSHFSDKGIYFLFGFTFPFAKVTLKLLERNLFPSRPDDDFTFFQLETDLILGLELQSSPHFDGNCNLTFDPNFRLSSVYLSHRGRISRVVLKMYDPNISKKRTLLSVRSRIPKIFKPPFLARAQPVARVPAGARVGRFRRPLRPDHKPARCGPPAGDEPRRHR